MEDAVGELTAKYRDYCFYVLNARVAGRDTPALYRQDKNFEADFMALGMTPMECQELAEGIHQDWKVSVLHQ